MIMSEEARSVIDRNTVADLPADNPNVAAGRGDYNHEDHIGGPADDHDIQAAAALLDFDDDGQAG